MQQDRPQLNMTELQNLVRQLTRRQVVQAGVGGGLAIGALMLAGCANKKLTGAELPNPEWDPPAYPTNTVLNVPGVPQVQPAPQPGRSVQVPPQTMPGPVSPNTGVIGRAQWTRTGVSRPRDINPMNGVRRITVHHDGMPVTTLRSGRDVAARLEQIRSSHVVGRGWADIGYHYIVDPSGRVWEGRNIRFQGAHVKDQNENNLGILVLGNFDQQTPTAQATSTLDRFILNQMQTYRIGMSNVRTHQERDQTACPGRSLQGYMVRTRSGGGQLAMMASRVGLA